MCGSQKIKKGLCAQHVIYSSGSVCTYHVDTGVVYREEVDSDASCLAPKTFTPQKTGWSFLGWREDTAANANVLSSKVMKDDPITLYAVFRQNVTLTTVANSVSNSKSAEKYFNNGNIANPVFTVTSPTHSAAAFRGWSSSANSTNIATATITNLPLAESTTMYAVFKYSDANIAGFNYSLTPNAGVQTIYSLDSAKYATHTVTAKIGDFNTSNNTIGWVMVYVLIDGQNVRVKKNTESDTRNMTEVDGYPGSYGKEFTITASGDITGMQKGEGFDPTPACVYISKIVLTGKTIVG